MKNNRKSQIRGSPSNFVLGIASYTISGKTPLFTTFSHSANKNIILVYEYVWYI